MTPNERMERVHWDAFWVPPDVRVVDRPELAYLICERPQFYLNQVLRTRAPERRWPALIAEVCAAHAHSTSMWMTFDTVDMSGLEERLIAADYQLLGRSHAMIADPSEFPTTTGEPMVTVRSVTDHTGLLHSLSVMEETFGVQVEHTEMELRHFLEQCTATDSRVVRMVAYDPVEKPIAAGCMNLYPALQLAYLWGGSTLPEARGRGAYTALLTARVAYARRRGIRLIGVYAMPETSAPILAKRGFRRCGAMNKWRKPPAGHRPG